MVRKGDTKVQKCASGDAGDGRLKRRGFSPGVGKIPWRRQWQPTPAFLPGKSSGQRSLVGYSPWGHKQLDTTELVSFFSFYVAKKSKCNGKYFIVN